MAVLYQGIRTTAAATDLSPNTGTGGGSDVLYAIDATDNVWGIPVWLDCACTVEQIRFYSAQTVPNTYHGSFLTYIMALDEDGSNPANPLYTEQITPSSRTSLGTRTVFGVNYEFFENILTLATPQALTRGYYMIGLHNGEPEDNDSTNFYICAADRSVVLESQNIFRYQLSDRVLTDPTLAPPWPVPVDSDSGAWVLYGLEWLGTDYSGFQRFSGVELSGTRTGIQQPIAPFSSPNFSSGNEIGVWLQAEPFTVDGIIWDAADPIEYFDVFLMALDEPAPPSSLYYAIYTNAGGSPGTVITSEEVPFTSGAYNNYVNYGPFLAAFYQWRVTPSAPILLPAGSYWLAIHAGPISNDTRLEWYWGTAAGAGLGKEDPIPVSGAWSGNGQSHAFIFYLQADDPPPATGACTMPDGSCEVLTEAECTLAGGTWAEGEACPMPFDSEIQIEALYNSAFSWYSDGRYFTSVGGKTHCFDETIGEEGAWTECGYGYVAGGVVIPQRGQWPTLTFLAANIERPVVGAFPTQVSYTHNQVTIETPYCEWGWTKEITFRCFDGNGPVYLRPKDLLRFTLWGKFRCFANRGRIGTLIVRTDKGGYQELPIYRNLPDDPTMILQQEFAPGLTGALIDVTVKLDDDVWCKIAGWLPEYIPEQ